MAQAAEAAERRGGESHSRAKVMDPHFTLLRHLSKSLGVASLILALGLYMARGASAVDWLLLPAFWVIANFFEWGIHKYPMHRPLFPRILYTNHALVHHRSFAGPDQEIVDRRELSLVMMPWYTLIMVFVMASPVALAAWLLGGLAWAGVFLIASVSYFLFYELVHTFHHLPQTLLDSIGLGGKWLGAFRASHHHHHQLENMAHTNFNVTLPLADKVLGTYYRDRR